jgi:hypothetical protein
MSPRPGGVCGGCQEGVRRPELSAEDILAVLNRHGVAYVVIGAFAPSPRVPRSKPTHDGDVTPRREPENLRRLSAALDELEACIRLDDFDEGLPFEHDATSLAGVANAQPDLRRR